MKMCQYWMELDGENGDLYEYCKKVNKKCTCAAAFDQCNFFSAGDAEQSSDFKVVLHDIQVASYNANVKQDECLEAIKELNKQLEEVNKAMFNMWLEIQKGE